MSRQVVTAAGFAVLAAMFWAATLGSASLLPAGFPTVEIVAGRYTVQLALLMVLVMPFRGTKLVRTSRPRLHILRGVTMIVMPITFELAVNRLGAGDALAAVWFAPLFGLAFGYLAMGESLRPASVAIASAATVGAFVASSPTAFASVSGAIAALCSAAAFGAFFTLTRALRGESAATGLFWTAACVAIPAIALLPLAWQPLTARSATALVLMGVLWLLVLLTIDEALRRAPLHLLAPFFLSEILWTRVLFRAPWSRGATAGLVILVVCAVWALVRSSDADNGLSPLRTSAAL
ncbi:MAG: EamA family transporter [bacterium]